MTPCNGTKRRTVREDAVNTRLAHLVVTFRVDQKAHVRIEVAFRFADGAVVCTPMSTYLEVSRKEGALPSSSSRGFLVGSTVRRADLDIVLIDSGVLAAQAQEGKTAGSQPGLESAFEIYGTEGTDGNCQSCTGR